MSVSGPSAVTGEPDQGGQAAIGEAGAAGLEKHPPDCRLAVDALGDTDECQAAGVQIRGEAARGAGDGVEIDGEPGSVNPSPLRLIVNGGLWAATGVRSKGRGRSRRPRCQAGAGGDRLQAEDVGPPEAAHSSGRGGARQRRRVLEVVHFAAGEGGATTIVRACVYHSVRVSRSRWDKAGAVYFADRPPDKQGAYAGRRSAVHRL